MSYKVKTVKPDDVQFERVESVNIKTTRTGPDCFPSDLSLESRTAFHFISKRTEYRVTVFQNVVAGNTRFQLWHGVDYSKAKEAFDSVQTALTPVLAKGSILLTTPLLEEIIIPSLVNSDSIIHRLINHLFQHPDDHPEWLCVAYTLLDLKETPPSDPALRKECIEELKVKYDLPNGANAIQLEDDISVTEEDESFADQIWDFIRGLGHKFDQMISLRDAVEKQHLKTCLEHVLSGKTDPNEQCPSTGDTALHRAIRKSNLTLVKLLLAYNADPTIANNEGETSLEAAEKLNSNKGSQIVSELKRITDLQNTAKAFFLQNPNVPAKGQNRGSFLLSLDGGGMRGIIVCHILNAIQNRMNELCDSCDNLCSYFDDVAGTSSGALIAVFLAYKSEICVSNSQMYLYRFMNAVFRSDQSKRGDKLKEFVVEVIGENTVMSDLEGSTNVIITSTIANISPSKLHLMTNYGKARDDMPGPSERKVWEACVATSAAPKYFPPFEVFLDGGLMANNPTLPAMADIFDRAKDKGTIGKIGFVLSLGTGTMFPPKDVDNFTVYVPWFSIDTLKMMFESSLGAFSLLEHFITESTQSSGQVVTQARAWCNSLGAPYKRLSPKFSEIPRPDISSIREVIDLLYTTEIYVLEQFKEIDEIAKIILSK